MKSKRLNESVYDYTQQLSAVEDMLDGCMQLHKDEEYAELGVFLGYLQAVGMMHQAHHWQTMGKQSYGDHLLFQRLYEAVGPEVDAVAEKVVGVGGIRMTNYFAQLHHMTTLLTAISQQQSLVMESLLAEVCLILCGEVVMSRLEEKGILTRGVEQALGNILDKHESHVYLLQQRVSQ